MGSRLVTKDSEESCAWKDVLVDEEREARLLVQSSAANRTLIVSALGDAT